MSKALITESILTDIANAIIEKGGASAPLRPTEMAEAIESIEPDLTTKSITANGTYNASSDNVDGYSSVTVSVQPSLATKSITANGTYNASSDNADGYSSVTVSVVTRYTATIIGSQNSNRFYVRADDTNYYTTGDTFTFVSGQTLQFCSQYGSRLYVNGVQVGNGEYIDYTAPASDISINLGNPVYEVVTEGQTKYTGTIQTGTSDTGVYVRLFGAGGNTYKATGATFTYFSGQDLEFVSNTAMFVTVDGVNVNSEASTTVHYTAPARDMYIDINANGFVITTVKRYTASIAKTYDGGNILNRCRVIYNNTTYENDGDTFEFIPKKVLAVTSRGTRSGQIYVDSARVATSGQDDGVSYNFTLPENDIDIQMTEGGAAVVYINNPTVEYNANGTYALPGYGKVVVSV